MGWLLRKLLSLAMGVLLVGLVSLGSLRWIPFPPRAVLEAAFTGQPYRWKWLAQEKQPTRLRQAFEWYHGHSLQVKRPSIAELTARHLFFAEDTPAWLVRLVGLLLEPLWGQERVLTFYLNVLPFRGAQDMPVCGIGAASQYLFRRLPNELSPAESAELVVRQRWPQLEEPLPASLRVSFRQVYRFLMTEPSSHASEEDDP